MTGRRARSGRDATLSSFRDTSFGPGSSWTAKPSSENTPTPTPMPDSVRTRPSAPTPLALALALAVAPLLAACGDGGGTGGPDAVVQDSAGVRIVTHAGEAGFPAWDADVAGRIALPGEFFQVNGALALSDGTHMVADGGTGTLRRFGPGGEALGSVGGRGEGPGEFQSIDLLAPFPGDSVLAFDLSLRRASIFSEDGSFGRTFALQLSDEAPFGNLRGVHRDGNLVATGFSQTPPGGPEDGRHWYTAPIFRYAADGSFQGRLEAEVGGESFFERFAGGGFTVFAPLFGRSTHLAVGPGLVVVASNDRWDVRVFTPDGTLAHRIRMGGSPPPPISSELRREAIQRALDTSTSTREPAELRRIFEGMELPPSLPAHARVRVDRLDHVWVERYAPAPVPDSEWLVFTPEGEAAGRVTLPAPFNPQDIGEDYLLGVLRDELEVEQVVRIPLRR